MRRMGLIRGLCVHHSVSDYGTTEIIRGWHKERGFADIGYHFVVQRTENSHDASRAIVELGRPLQYEGAGVFGNNSGLVHVCLVGNFEKYRPSVAQLNSFGLLWLDLRGRFMAHGTLAKLANFKSGVSWQQKMRLPFYGHREITVPGHGTLCPGTYFPSLTKLRVWAIDRIDKQHKLNLGDWCREQHLA